ncbi:MAG: isoprenylcysteine carboxylmethyltransferase family protein [Armatimonadetes bacterium]|nr:isoprenylcysteine carboxylmethyltransferase family protein [Armatimonadota bacterium]
MTILDRIVRAVHGREARPASPAWNVTKTLLQTVVFWSVFLFLVPQLILLIEDRVGANGSRFASPLWRTIGVALFIVGGSFGLTSGVVMAWRGQGTPLPADCPRALVVAGPYRYVRNPMAFAGLSQGAAVGLFVGSASIVAYAILGGIIWHFFVRPWEEADLEARFGEPYRLYRAAVRCWIPRLRPYIPGSDIR